MPGWVPAAREDAVTTLAESVPAESGGSKVESTDVVESAGTAPAESVVAGVVAGGASTEGLS